MAPGLRPSSEGPVTVAVSRVIKPGAEAAFETWLAGVCRVATGFEGHMGVSVLRPPAGGRKFVLIFRFDTLEHLARWNESAERAEWLARAEPLTSGQPTLEVTTGLEHWFTLPDAGLAPPARHKMALLSWVAIFPLVVGVSAALAPWVGSWPWPLPMALTTAVMVVLMTYLVMPRMTRLFQSWLYPER